MSGDATLKSISDNLNALSSAMTGFVSAQTVINESQKVTNETNAKTFEKLSDSLAKSESMQVEINGINQKQTEQQCELSSLSKDFSAMHEQVSITKLLVGQTQDLKKVFIRSMIGAFFVISISLGSSIYMSAVKTQANADVAAAIAEMVKGKE